MFFRSGGRPWYKWDPNYDPRWDFVADFCPDDYDDVFLVAGSEEWCKMMDAYVFFCFNIAGFQIVRTVEMGLGILLL
jgi:hypothetical protein